MFGKMDPRKMQAMMKKMGIKTEPIEADEVVIKGEKEIVIRNPQVTVIEVQGQKTFQIVGEIVEKEAEERKEAVSEEDVKLVMEQVGASKEEAAQALKQTKGDIAEAILKLKKD